VGHRTVSCDRVVARWEMIGLANIGTLLGMPVVATRPMMPGRAARLVQATLDFRRIAGEYALPATRLFLGGNDANQSRARAADAHRPLHRDVERACIVQRRIQLAVNPLQRLQFISRERQGLVRQRVSRAFSMEIAALAANALSRSGRPR